MFRTLRIRWFFQYLIHLLCNKMNIERGNSLKTLEKKTCFVYGAPVWCNTYHIVVNVVSVQVFVTYVTYSVLIEVLLI